MRQEAEGKRRLSWWDSAVVWVLFRFSFSHPCVLCACVFLIQLNISSMQGVHLNSSPKFWLFFFADGTYTGIHLDFCHPRDLLLSHCLWRSGGNGQWVSPCFWFSWPPVSNFIPTLSLSVRSENRTSIKFLAVGDWGGVPYAPYTTAVQKATAQEMSKVAEQMGADFVLALGDNFYYRGVNSVDSPRFQVSWIGLLYPGKVWGGDCKCNI